MRRAAQSRPRATTSSASSVSRSPAGSPGKPGEAHSRVRRRCNRRVVTRLRAQRAVSLAASKHRRPHRVRARVPFTLAGRRWSGETQRRSLLPVPSSADGSVMPAITGRSKRSHEHPRPIGNRASGEWRRWRATPRRSIGREVTLARTNLGLTRYAASVLAGVSPSTQIRVEEGDPRIGLDTACRVAAGVGLKLWAKAFPVRAPSLRDSRSARGSRSSCRASAASPQSASPSSSGSVTARSIDMVFLGRSRSSPPRSNASSLDFQAQYRLAAAKRDELALAPSAGRCGWSSWSQDSRRNRAVLSAAHSALIRQILPAGSREVLRADSPR